MEHALQLLRELVSTLDLQLCKHAPFRIIRDASVVEQALGEMVLVVQLELVFLREVPENSDSLPKYLLDLFIGLPFEPFLEVLVDEERRKLGRAGLLVDERLEGLQVQREYSER